MSPDSSRGGRHKLSTTRASNTFPTRTVVQRLTDVAQVCVFNGKRGFPEVGCILKTIDAEGKEWRKAQTTLKSADPFVAR